MRNCIGELNEDKFPLCKFPLNKFPLCCLVDKEFFYAFLQVIDHMVAAFSIFHIKSAYNAMKCHMPPIHHPPP